MFCPSLHSLQCQMLFLAHERHLTNNYRYCVSANTSKCIHKATEEIKFIIPVEQNEVFNPLHVILANFKIFEACESIK